MNNYYNPMQSRVDSLMQQKAMIEQQLQSLQQMNVPNININNIPSNPTPSNFDFNGKWVDGEEQASQQECCCTTQRAIDNVVAQDYKNTCEITTAIHAEGEATRALINANTMQELRDRLADRDRDLLTANFQLSQQAQSANIISTLQPTPKPAYLTCSPYYAYNSGACFGNGCGCNGTTL